MSIIKPRSIRQRMAASVLVWSVAVLSGALALVPANALAAQPATAVAAAPSQSSSVPEHIQRFATQVLRSGDAGDHDFAVLDKAGAAVWVFDQRGALVGESVAIVGYARGDTAPADIGSRPLSRVKPHEKITPAGRFTTEPGTNHKGEEIIWLDYESALSMHRVRNVPGENRFKRIASANVDERRISFGCVNLPASFYDRVLAPRFRQQSGVVYILPESSQLASVFPFAGPDSAVTTVPAQRAVAANAQ